jgi:hypothetical protein
MKYRFLVLTQDALRAEQKAENDFAWTFET